MAIGARISSTNLSGKTATVTFTPYTGTTSGTTVNLGTQTIPFNNITTHPYGDYAIYLAEYDYTYTLNIPEPLSNPQRFFVVDRMVGSNNYGVGVLNFDDFTAEVIDLNIDGTYWDNSNIYPLQNSGCMHIFQGQSNYQEKLVIFTNANGEIVGQHTGTTANYSADSLLGKWVTFENVDGGVLVFSNGTSMYTYTWNPLTHTIDIESDWDSATSDGTFIIKKFEIGSWEYDGNGESYLVNPTDGTTTLFKTWLDGTLVNHQMAISADFIAVYTRTQSPGGTSYTSLEIYGTTGTILETVSLTGATYDNRNHEFIGTNIYTAVFNNDGDYDVDYKIIHYNGNTTTLTQTSHVKGAEYTSINIYGDNNFYPERSNINGGVVIMFYNTTNYTSYGDETTFCDFVYMLPTQTQFTVYQFANNQTKYINSWGQLSNFYRIYCSTGNGFLEFLTISLTGTSITTSPISVSDINQVNMGYMTNRSLFNVYTNGSNTVNYILVNESGVIEDIVTEELSSAWSSGYMTNGGLAYINVSGISGDTGYYVYSGSTGFTQTGYYSNQDAPNTFENNETYLTPVVLVLYNYNSQNFRVLTPTGITNNLTFPEQWNNQNLVIGKDKFMLVYSSTSDSLTKIRLYDFNGQLLNSQTTTYNNGWNGAWGCKDRFLVQLYAEGGGTSEYILVNETNNQSITLQSVDTESTVNDFQYWWD